MLLLDEPTNPPDAGIRSVAGTFPSTTWKGTVVARLPTTVTLDNVLAGWIL